LAAGLKPFARQESPASNAIAMPLAYLFSCDEYFYFKL
jgi:hypothetical protein